MTDNRAIDDRIASGIDTAMMTVERQLPRKIRIITEVSSAAMMPSRATEAIADLTNTDWSLSIEIFSDGGIVSSISGISFLTPATTASVEASPVFRIGISTARLPSTRTTLFCGGEPSRTWATWPIVMVAPLTVLIGRLFSAANASGLLLSLTLYS